MCVCVAFQCKLNVCYDNKLKYVDKVTKVERRTTKTEPKLCRQTMIRIFLVLMQNTKGY